ncbi:helix-turn-helix transcriptional regulator [Eubacterium sp. 1001713B170207_170306_E7]|uniref:helix-turn-helix domain-containing protein n=1 Tax=Eubacterium sp. 1001713B170207_170306_E7 TaxID=2787097 RepID=UPI00189C0E16|nr:helix-turn-helix transcriptional regulator [Eubacterium sp. 1001713B170207_170306_E7]
MGFGENLRRIRRDRQLSQEELAERLKVSRQAVSKWEQGSGYPEVEKLLLLSELLEVSLDHLMAEDSQPETGGGSGAGNTQNAGRILIEAFDGRSIVNCCRVQASPRFRTKKDEPKYALFGVDGSSFWGENTTVLGWYAGEEALEREIQEIKKALAGGCASYTLKYAVKVKRHWGKIKIVE